MFSYVSSFLDRTVAGKTWRLSVLLIAWLVALYLAFEFLGDCVFGDCEFWWDNYRWTRQLESRELLGLLFMVEPRFLEDLRVSPRVTAAIWTLTAASYFWFLFWISPSAKVWIKKTALGEGGTAIVLIVVIPLLLGLALLSAFLWGGTDFAQFGALTRARAVVHLLPFAIGFACAFATIPAPDTASKNEDINVPAGIIAVVLTAAFWIIKPASTEDITSRIQRSAQKVQDKAITLDEGLIEVAKILRDGRSSGYWPTQHDFILEVADAPSDCRFMVLARIYSVQGSNSIVEEGEAERSQARAIQFGKAAGLGGHLCISQVVNLERIDVLVAMSARLCGGGLLRQCAR